MSLCDPMDMPYLRDKERDICPGKIPMILKFLCFLSRVLSQGDMVEEPGAGGWDSVMTAVLSRCPYQMIPWMGDAVGIPLLMPSYDDETLEFK